ncbi:hypothetical protein Thiowin_04317 [Thiorhodovibrio winogradskyi]|uniref:Putative restriction endonuclease domain-containing protein n=1 Tax=Thiorhodovibrio winogradskyi TaxID=77007 RepID=A0ABZ0SFC3_9GAMM|nr:Uma2 family endonuclease [Thiorhodovibrio winogradskyi]
MSEIDTGMMAHSIQLAVAPVFLLTGIGALLGVIDGRIARVSDDCLPLVAVQDPLTLAPHSEPEPDLMLLRPRDDFYEGANPTPADTLLVIEICDSSLRYDREVKVPLYAAQGVPEVWLVDLQHRRLELYREASADGYRLMLRPAPGEVVAPVLLPDVRLRVDELW